MYFNFVSKLILLITSNLILPYITIITIIIIIFNF